MCWSIHLDLDLPWLIATPDGAPAKTGKPTLQRASQLRASLEKIDLVPAQHNDWPDHGSVPCNFYQEPRVQEGPSRARSKVEARNAPHSRRNVCVMAWIRQTWQPFLCKSGSNHTAGRSLPRIGEPYDCDPWCGMSQAGCWGRRYLLQLSGWTMHTARGIGHPHPTACQPSIIWWTWLHHHQVTRHRCSPVHLVTESMFRMLFCAGTKQWQTYINITAIRTVTRCMRTFESTARNTYITRMR